MVNIKAYIDLFQIHRPVDEFVDCIVALDREIATQKLNIDNVAEKAAKNKRQNTRKR